MASKRDMPQKTTIWQLDTDDEIYEWIDAIYNRCLGTSGVSNPTNFSHRVHDVTSVARSEDARLSFEFTRVASTQNVRNALYYPHVSFHY